ncbi:hypothetical protein CS0771_12020 [Catellatospora sp. IY07-71]|uniref:TIGR04255 family protein n=1 Tax=Catellatospora sp. IY07-71 TaxID=2728827 RepID=UPI001BB3D6D0|nr:TIGR04255 family protein [Catellatospora sp. IY07-71]BCJ71658.1 hypothetical protein CS0771_12020 [Catellatospora sp. IY07-71]
MSSGPRFDRPPVREVALTVQFDALQTMQTLTLAPLRVDWSPEYPKLSEVAPRSPLTRTGANVEFVSSEAPWPVPRCTFISADGNRAIEIQHDRFGVTWSFDSDAPSYPGFGALSAELAARFGQFEALINSSLGVDIQVNDVEIEYENHIEGIRAEELCFGILSGWAQSTATLAEPTLDYAGMRFHYCASPSNDNTAILVGVDTAESDGNGSASTLRLEVQRDTDSSKVFVESLSIAHEVLVRRFLEVTTPAMHSEWGLRA